MRIAYFLETLASMGGVERMLTDKANYMSNIFGYEVYIITCTQNPAQKNAFTLSDKVKTIQLGIPYYSQYRYSYPKRLWVKWKLERQIKKRLTNTVRQFNIDVLIGVGHFKAALVCSIQCRAKRIIESHEARPFTLSGLSQYRNALSSAYMRIYRKNYFRIIEQKADIVVSLTEGDANEWKKARRVEVIPNFSSMKINQLSNCKNKRIIAAGRLSWEKGYSRLIDIWEIVEGKHPDWHLDIFGDGDLRFSLEAEIEKRKLLNITIRQPVKDITKEYADSSICVMTSYYEGFSLVLIEALRHSVPCVAFDCPFGPKSIIDDGRCGFLIQDNNISLYAEKVCKLIEDDGLRQQFSKNCLEQAKKFEMSVVMEKWNALLEQLTA